MQALPGPYAITDAGQRHSKGDGSKMSLKPQASMKNNPSPGVHSRSVGSGGRSRLWEAHTETPHTSTAARAAAAEQAGVECEDWRPPCPGLSRG